MTPEQQAVLKRLNDELDEINRDGLKVRIEDPADKIDKLDRLNDPLEVINQNPLFATMLGD